ncbi:MAG TPA: hypothetical protein VFV67_05580 [Actinophytocola sp.]|uniref:putative T7SS-secreted protein n=1 Tax=Actinophytocola sp. TaxID=1872138 RepID=UPI002DB83342|nr:hypothetical protein [Actinophytocola sp.]HEU5470105.1 hypothetical protein [Actinophytocola sp.]
MSAGRSFPALGFDPAEGDNGAVQTALLSIATALQTIVATLPRLEEAAKITDDAEWGGSAAEEFSDHGDDLPMALGKGAESMGAVSEALATWAGQLVANQAQADDLERTAKKLKEQIKAAEADLTEAAGAIPRDTSHPQYDARYTAYLGAVDKCAKLDDALTRVIDEAKRLRAKHRRQADAAADKIRSGPDDGFEPENDAWYVQTLDGVSKVSGIVSAATAAAAAGLAITGVGAPAAAVLGAVATGTGGISLLAGVGQRVAGSRNAPGNIDLLLNALPARTVTSGAIGGVKGLARPTLEAGRLRKGVDGLREGAVDGFTAAGYPLYLKHLTEYGQLARKHGLSQALRHKIATDGAIKVLSGNDKLAAEAFVQSVDATVRTIEASGTHLSPAQKRELELLKVLANPTQTQLENSGIKATADAIKGK